MAKDFPEYTFAVADEDDFATEVKDLGLSESGEDVNAAILDEGGRKFAMEPDDFDSDTLREFVRAFKKGEAWSHPLGAWSFFPWAGRGAPGAPTPSPPLAYSAEPVPAFPLLCLRDGERTRKVSVLLLAFFSFCN